MMTLRLAIGVALAVAVTGGAFSHLVLAILLIVFAGIILPAVTGDHDPARSTKCMSNLSQLGKAMKMYARDH